MTITYGKLGLLATLVSSSFLTFLKQPQVTNWTKPKLDGLYTRAVLFIKGLENKNQLTQRSSSGNSILPSSNYDIQQVSQQISATNSPSETPALIAEIPLTRLDQKNYFKYCIPSNSPLLKSQEQVTTSSDTTSCKLEWFGSQQEYEKTKKEEISFLLETMAKFIETQHASNILLFYDKSINYINNGQGGSGVQKSFSAIQKACNLKQSNHKELIKELFFSPRDCLLSPSSTKINWEVLNSSVQSKMDSTREIKADKEQLSNSKISGDLRYWIFDYSAQLKKISVENGEPKKEKHMALNINWPLTFYLGEKNPNHCFLNPIWKKVKSRELTFEELKRRCDLIS